MNLCAINHTPISKDAYISGPGKLTIRIRTERNDITGCRLWYGDRVCVKNPIEVFPLEMEQIASDQLFDYFEADIETEFTRICYYFELMDKNGRKIFYSEYGFSEIMTCSRTQYFQYPFLHHDDAIVMPEWTKSMVMYHIFPDSFASGKRQIDRIGKTFLSEDGKEIVTRNGGTLRGIIENLDYIKSLHVNCLYLNPVFEAASYHKYDTIDYKKVDPCFGTMDDLKELVQLCHENHIRVILDGVFNHCGSRFAPFQDVLKNGRNSRFFKWFYRVETPVRYEENPNYETYAYVKEMPKLDTSNPEVQKYFCDVGRFWIRETDIDGWRLDVANEINHDFWRAFRKAVKKEKPDAFLIGEIWEDSTVWLRGDQFDSTMNYSFCYNCREFFAEKSITVSEFDEKMQHMYLRYPEMVSQVQMNFLDTHDVPRFLSYCKGNKRKLRLAVFYMMTAMGIPSVFYGDEMGCEGVTEAEYRMPMPWQDGDYDLKSYYARLMEVRNAEPALQSGKYRTVYCDNVSGIYAFLRKKDDDEILVILNNSDRESSFSLPEEFQNRQWKDLITGESFSVTTIAGYTGKILKTI